MRRLWEWYKRLTKNEEEGRYRALPRVGAQTAILTLAGILGAVPILMWAYRTARITREEMIAQDVGSLMASGLLPWLYVIGLQLICVTGSVLLVAYFIDRRFLRDLGFHRSKGWWMDFGFGVALGALLMGGIFFVQYLLGWVLVVDTFRATDGLHPGALKLGFWPTVLAMLLVWLSVGFYEELLARGFLIKNLSEGLVWKQKITARLAVLIVFGATSVLFGLGHAFNPNATWTGVLGTGLAGVLLGLPYVLTGQLGMSIGLHFAWNFCQGCVFGFPVSGMQARATFVATEQGGPDLWTGGAFGPEAGLLGLVAILVGMGLVVVWVWLTRGKVAVEERLAVAELRPKPETPPWWKRFVSKKPSVAPAGAMEGGEDVSSGD